MMNENKNMEDSLHESIEETFNCRNKCGRISNVFCTDCKLEFCFECSKLIHSFKAFSHHQIDNNVQHISITNLNNAPQEKSNNNDKDIWINPSDFKLYQVLSNVGAESKVIIGKLFGNDCVAKQSKQNTEATREQYANEIRLMKTVAHQNIATFLGASYYKPNPNSEALITIFYERLEPSEPIILIQKGAKATHFQRLKYLHQVSLGLSYLAGMKIYHGDIKLGNLLYDRKGDKFKLCDWGFAKDLRSNAVGPAKGTPLHVAPELWKVLLANKGTNASVKYDSSIDVYAFGILGYTILTGIKLSPNMNVSQLATAVVNGTWRPNLDDLKDHYPRIVKELLSLCWNGEPKKRPTFQQIVETYMQVYLDFMFGEGDNIAKVWFRDEFFLKPLTQVLDHFYIPWAYFNEKFSCNFLGLNEPIHPSQREYVLLEYLLKENDHVNANNFAHVIKFYSGFVINQERKPNLGENQDNESYKKRVYVLNGKQWLQNLQLDFLIDGWYGNLSKEETSNLLKNASPGEYVLRYSTTPGSWVVSIANNKRTVNIKIDHQPFTSLYQIKSDDGKIINFNSLREAFEFIKKNVNLRSPVTIRPPNQRIFDDNKDDSSNYYRLNILKKVFH